MVEDFWCFVDIREGAYPFCLIPVTVAKRRPSCGNYDQITCYCGRNGKQRYKVNQKAEPALRSALAVPFDACSDCEVSKGVALGCC